MVVIRQRGKERIIAGVFLMRIGCFLEIQIDYTFTKGQSIIMGNWSVQK